MRKYMHFIALILLANITALGMQAQVVLTGSVKAKASGETLSAVSVSVKGTNRGTFTDDKGTFRLSVDKLPVTLVFSSIGYADQEVNVSAAGPDIAIALAEKVELGQEVVVSATRTSTRILESPVSIERIGASAIREAPAASFYDAIANLKGVDFVKSGLLFNTIGTRGFNGSGNVRLNQFTDGMDNQAPGLNFSVANLIGLTELDVDNVELLPGASSALYGSGGMNGTLLINSKNPFKHQGLSFQVKQGVNHTDGRQRSIAPYYDWNFRWGKKVSEKFAFKIAGQFIQAQDWQAVDYRNYDVANSKIVNGDRGLPSYNGVNVYGDQIGSTPPQINARAIVRSTVYQQAYQLIYNQLIGAGFTPEQAAGVAAQQATAIASQQSGQLFATGSDSIISRTGWAEKDLVDYSTYNVKFNGGLYYKLNPKTELSLVGYWGMGTTVYTGADRYALKDVRIGQYKLELKGENYYVRGYTTQENSGDAYATTILASQMLQGYSNTATQWAPTYIQSFVAARSGLFPGFSGINLPEDMAHNLARNAADANRPAVGSAAFNNLFNRVRTTPISRGGALFLDKTDMYVAEGMYNLKKITWADVQVGGMFRRFVLNSQGTLFTDTLGRIGINEFGAYVQVQKSLFDDVVKLNFAGRFDKNQNFKGRFTPRATALIKVAKDNNIRLSYQQAYRFPTTQNQFINLPLGTPSNMLIGGLSQFQDLYGFNTPGGAVWDSSTVGKFARGQIPTLDANNAYQFKEFNPEVVNSYEAGYRGVLGKKLLLDVYAFYARYSNFIATAILVQAPGTANQRQFGMPVNSTEIVETFGWGASADYRLPANFNLSANVSYNELRNAAAGTLSFFNTPKYRYNVTLSNNKLFKNFGAAATWRWQDEITMWESTFLSGYVPSFGVLDAQVTYRIPKTKNAIKLGANNLLNKYYQTAFGNPAIGGLYYVSYGYNIF